MIGGFTDTYYWSSSEYDSDNTEVWLVSFETGSSGVTTKDGGLYPVRPIRLF
jgi:hypothetical protein